MRFRDDAEYQEFLRGRTFPQVKSAPELSAAVKVEKSVGKPTLAAKPHERGTRNGKHAGPNKTEGEYGRLLAMEFPMCKVSYEPLTIKMANGHRYTPDWAVHGVSGRVMLIEVKARGKNGFRHPSYQRAKLAFDQCREEWGEFMYRWAEKQEGKWNVTDY